MADSRKIVDFGLRPVSTPGVLPLPKFLCGRTELLQHARPVTHNISNHIPFLIVSACHHWFAYNILSEG